MQFNVQVVTRATKPNPTHHQQSSLSMKLLHFLYQPCYSTCLSGFQINNHLRPEYFTKAFSQSLKPHITRNQHKLPSSSNHNRLNLHNLKSFNSLPKDLRLWSLNSFKCNLQLYLFSQLIILYIIFVHTLSLNALYP